ncbi:hypothetical protein [Prosthecobacter dejongeii]|uniref:Uncharacterized protein n=1 Tax=Prosthecobacter dejongeii TaxID=48465 RepID=A0A7W7YGY1_9BACT|nr:hypothetical protein [Prosthecobacter dejongeii]MBB5036008.1 hypothetical protein [Prosthecobacter dejongeii]
MPLSHTLLSLTAAVGLWWAGHAVTCTQPSLQAARTPPAFAFAGSAYGSLTARLIRDSLYSYWHGGESTTAAAVPTPAKGSPAPPPPAGRFARKGMPAPPPPPAISSKTPWLQKQVDELARLEKNRTRRNSTFPLSQAHQRYLNAAGDVRLRFAYQLDPGDATLYEILHYHIAARTRPSEAAVPILQALAQQAMNYGLRQDASLADALTGAGAAINLLNEQLRPERILRDAQAISQHRDTLARCLDHYQNVRSTAQAEGWWENIPPLRRQELEEHAKFLTHIREVIQRTQPSTGPGPSNVPLLKTP